MSKVKSHFTDDMGELRRKGAARSSYSRGQVDQETLRSDPAYEAWLDEIEKDRIERLKNGQR